MVDKDVTSLQRRMLISMLESHQQLTKYTVPFQEAVSHLKRVKKTLDSFGPIRSMEFCCRYWNQWQLHVIDKGLYNLDNIDDLDMRVWVLVDKTNNDVYNPYPVKDSPLMKLRQDLLHFDLEKEMIRQGYRVFNVFDHPDMIVDGENQDIEVPQMEQQIEVIDLAENNNLPQAENDIEGRNVLEEIVASEDGWPTREDLLYAFSIDDTGEVSIVNPSDRK